MTWQRPSLEDLRGRTLRYVRMSVTDRCQFRCPYCRPKEGESPCSPGPELLQVSEFGRISRVLQRIGIDTVRLTGGEPLLRRDLADIIKAVHDTGIRDLAITSNGALLTPTRAKALAAAGLARINISIDTLDAERFRTLSGGATLEPVLRGLRAAADSGLQLKTNTVVVRDQNEDELLPIAQFIWSLGGVPRFIEVMPVGAGKDLTMVPASEIMAKFRLSPEENSSSKRAGIGPSDYWIHDMNPDQVVGVIAATTRNFCARCNRIRVTATGQIRPCLASASGVDLRKMLREDHADDDTILAAIQESLSIKVDGHRFIDAVASENSMLALGG